MPTPSGRAPRPAATGYDPFYPPWTPSEAIYADPATTEDHILSHGIPDMRHLDAVMSRPNKSEALVTAIVNDFRADAHMRYSDRFATRTLRYLLAEPALSANNLADIAQVTVMDLFADAGLWAAICLHPAVREETIITVAWTASTAIARDIAVATGLLLPAATSWVGRRRDLTESDRRDWYVTVRQRAEIKQVAHTWAAWAGTDRNLVSFLQAGSFAFADQDVMFAAALAVCAPPAGP